VPVGGFVGADDDAVFAADGNRMFVVDRETGALTTFTYSVPGYEAAPYAGGLAAAGAESVYVSDAINGLVLRLDVRTGFVEVVAGLDKGVIDTVGRFGDSDEVRYIAADRAGKAVYASYWGRVVRIATASGKAKAVAGDGQPGTAGDGEKARLARVAPNGLALDRRRNLYLANLNDYQPPTDVFSATIRRVDARTKRIETVAGRLNWTGDYGGDGGPALGAGLAPGSIAFDRAENLFVGDGRNGRVRVIKSLGR
jgi:hypothetical protein